MTLVFDADPLVAFLMAELRAPRVRALLERTRARREDGLVSSVNMAEVTYAVERQRPGGGRNLADSFAEAGVGLVGCEETWGPAARLKVRHPEVSLADCFAAATARVHRGELVVVGDDALLRMCAAEGIPVRRV